MCLATITDGESIPPDTTNLFTINFRATKTRKQYYSCPQKGKGRVKYQVNKELDGFGKGDIVLVKGKWEKMVRSIYSNGNLAFQRVVGEPSECAPDKCKLLEKSRTIMFNNANN